MSRHTKIVATVGPASNSPEMIEALLVAGVDLFRLNFSHGTHESHRAAYQTIRDASARTGRVAAVMQDLSGPKIRTGLLAGGTAITLQEGDELAIVGGDEIGRQGRVSTTFVELVRSARPGDRLLLDDGKLELRVAGASPNELKTVVVTGGPLGEHKGINAPGVRLPASCITDKDAADLRFGLDLGVDFVALSFVQTADDVARATALML
jgi:pyruvate kinase